MRGIGGGCGGAESLIVTREAGESVVGHVIVVSGGVGNGDGWILGAGCGIN